MKIIRLLATITVTDDYHIDDPYWTLENAVSESFEDEELESVEIVEEADFDEEFNKYQIRLHNPFNSGADIYEFAKHFYELGLKAQGE